MNSTKLCVFEFPDVLSIFDKENKDQNLELYLNDAMSADLQKKR